LCELAEAHDDSFYLGIEVRPDAAESAARLIRKKGITNALVINTEAEAFVAAWPGHSLLDAVHIYHPTPHPHLLGLSRRLLNPAFVSECARLLAPGGLLRIITDHQKYFTEAVQGFTPDVWFETDWIFDSIAQSRGCYVGTPTELEYRRKQLPIFAAQFMRKA
jgi:tRNA G46 methylase TrmB